MAAVTYAIRVLPLAFIRREITNKTLRSFLYYMPYVTLAAMTFPAIITATKSPVSGWGGFLFAVALSLLGGDLFKVSIGACVTVLLIEAFL
jgi:branched-subunit amino acid transport protein